MIQAADSQKVIFLEESLYSEQFCAGSQQVVDQWC